jgi:hypothetical protein
VNREGNLVGADPNMSVLQLDARMAVNVAHSAKFSSTTTLYEYDLILWDLLRSIET